MSGKENLAKKDRPASIRNDEQTDDAGIHIKSLPNNDKTTASSNRTGGNSLAIQRYMERLRSKMKSEDLQAATTLIKQHPHLSEYFTAVAAFMVTVEQSPDKYGAMADQITVFAGLTKPKEDVIRVGSFAIAVGFVERAVHLYHQIMFEKGMEYVTWFGEDIQDPALKCLYRITSATLNYPCDSMEFGLRVVQTGVLNNFMNDVIHLRDETDRRLESGRVYFQSLGCVYNCSMNAETLSIIRALRPVDHITPFLTRTSSNIKLLALLTLANIMDDAQNELLLADGNMLKFLLEQVQYAWRGKGSPFHDHFSWTVEGLLHGLHGLSKNDANKRRIFEKGALPLLVSILEEGNQSEKTEALAVIWELAFDKENSRQIRRNQRLMRILDEVKNSAQQSSGHAASAVWVIRNRTTQGAQPGSQPDTAKGNKTVPRLLTEQSNMLTILGTSGVEYVLSRLRGPTRGDNKYTRAEVLQALEHLVKDKASQAELLVKGGLDILVPILEDGREDEKIHVVDIMLALASDPAAITKLKAHPKLLTVVKELRWADNNVLGHRAQNFVWAMEEIPEAEGHQAHGQGHGSTKRPYILVSCHHSDVMLANQVVDVLRAQHYTVQLHDVTETGSDSGTTLVTTPAETARMVEGAAVVVVCVSYRYKLSAQCRMECEYAANLNKEVMALRVDPDYQPDGWLRQLLDKAKVNVDVTDPATRDSSLGQLVALLGSRGKTA